MFVGEHSLLVEGPSDLLYLQWASDELRSRGRTPLDRRWTIDMFVDGQDEADIEDILGRRLYIEVVNRAYGLDAGEAQQVDDRVAGDLPLAGDEHRRRRPGGGPP